MKKYIAELKRWNGEKEEVEIKKEWINDIVFAVESQCLFVNNKEGFEINGSNYCHVDIYEVEKCETT